MKRRRRARSGGLGWGLIALLAAAAAAAAYLLPVAIDRYNRLREQARREEERVRGMLSRIALIPTEHGSCRMACRKISYSEAREVLRKGSYDRAKSRDGKYTFQANVGGRNLTAVFAPAGWFFTNIVTVIDRDRDWPCPPC